VNTRLIAGGNQLRWLYIRHD